MRGGGHPPEAYDGADIEKHEVAETQFAAESCHFGSGSDHNAYDVTKTAVYKESADLA
jgi:hypothetical protein